MGLFTNVPKMIRSVALVLVLGWSVCCRAEIVLDNGVIRYADSNGHQRTVGISSRCADLWVSPDESVIVFIAVKESVMAISPASSDLRIDRSSVYLARRSGGFVPVEVFDDTITVAGRSWHVFRHPRISPDLKMLYFEVPFTMTTSRLYCLDLDSRRLTDAGDEADYCVDWGGAHSGDLLVQIRALIGDKEKGIEYSCYLQHLGRASKIAADCEDFEDFERHWSKANASSCR